METDHPTINWDAAPGWSNVVGELGRWSVIAASALFLISALVWLFGFRSPKNQSLAKAGFYFGALGIVSAALCLWTLILNRQYQFDYVFQHSDNFLTIDHRIASFWGGQQGSFLLWALTSSIFGVLALRRTGEYQRWFGIIFALFMASLAAILAFESPFRHWVPPTELVTLLAGKVPPDGQGLNASLINYWMVIHPPTIFSGFGSLAVLYAWSMSALINGNMTDWTKMVRPWALVSLTLCGIGLCMGGFWAYETLGWGGFWKWDPVENASLVPWLLCAAFIHNIFTAVSRRTWLIGTALFGGMTFVSFIYGTFLTRSGFLGDSSVHSFVEMDRSALWILAGMLIAALVPLIVFAVWRSMKMKLEPDGFETVSRINLQNGYGIASGLLTSLAIASAIGMSVPLFMSMGGNKPKVVDEQLYNRVSAWMFIPIVILMGAGPYLSWRGLPFNKLVFRLSNVFAITVGLLGLAMIYFKFIPGDMAVSVKDQIFFTPTFHVSKVIWIGVLAFVCIFGAVANLYRFIETPKAARSSAGSFIAHTGVILTVLGLIVSRGLEKTAQFDVQNGRPGFALGYSAALSGVGKGLDVRENQIKLDFEDGKDKFTAEPTLFYVFDSQGTPQPTVRPWISHHWTHDIYVTAFPIQTEATAPTMMAPGSERSFEGWTIRYEEMVREGEVGIAGTKFGARLTCVSPDGKVYSITPKMEIGAPSDQRNWAQLGDEFFVAMVGMDAATKSANIQLNYTNPIFPMEIFYKPLVGLVWGGAGIMTIGGLLAAWQRRKQLRASSASVSTQPEPDATPIQENDASPAAAQS